MNRSFLEFLVLQTSENKLLTYVSSPTIIYQFSENESLFVIKYEYNKKIMRVNKLNKI